MGFGLLASMTFRPTTTTRLLHLRSSTTKPELRKPEPAAQPQPEQPLVG